MQFRPLHDWVLIRRSKAAEMTNSGIIIPDSAKDKPAEGIVEAVGPGRYKEEEGKKEDTAAASPGKGTCRQGGGVA